MLWPACHKGTHLLDCAPRRSHECLVSSGRYTIRNIVEQLSAQSMSGVLSQLSRTSTHPAGNNSSMSIHSCNPGHRKAPNRTLVSLIACGHTHLSLCPFVNSTCQAMSTPLLQAVLVCLGSKCKSQRDPGACLHDACALLP